MKLNAVDCLFVWTLCGVFSLQVACKSIFRNDIQSALTQNGCKNFESSQPLTSNVVACHGSWVGHIRNADGLCRNGFKVCTWEDSEALLKEIRWQTAIRLKGCFALNAAQDGDRCLSCTNDINSDDLAGLGKDCPYRSSKRSGCLSGGRIDARCCNDTLSNTSCFYVPQLTTGVLCCRREDKTNIVQMDTPPSAELIRKNVGEKLTLYCPIDVPANGKVLWFKNNRLEIGKSSNNVLSFQTVSLSDSALYACRLSNSNSSEEIRFNLTINFVESNACADGSSEAFHEIPHVKGCAGSWSGHIKRADRQLCGKGWKVCSWKDKSLLQKAPYAYVQTFGGCYAYNAAHVKQKCRRCQNKHSMSALGSDCAVNEKILWVTLGRHNRTTCYANRIIQSYSDKFVLETSGEGCLYHKDKNVTGVLCCEKKKSRLISGRKKSDIGCVPSCKNGGTCIDGKCNCNNHYSGTYCQNAECHPRCLNNGLCENRKCQCEFPFYGHFCQHQRPNVLNDAPSLLENNQLE